MQTFLPYPSFAKSAEVLDYRRLGKQRVEAYQLWRCFHTDSSWRDHPAFKMWEKWENALIQYALIMCAEWISRGYNDSMMERFPSIREVVVPDWFGGNIHTTHRAALLAKNYEYYSQFGWTEEPKIEYDWAGYSK